MDGDERVDGGGGESPKRLSRQDFEPVGVGGNSHSLSEGPASSLQWFNDPSCRARFGIGRRRCSQADSEVLMAGRTGMGVGLGVTVFLLSISTLGFGVGTAMLWTKYNNAQQALKNAQAETSEIITPGEKNNDIVRRLIQNAKRAGNKSLVAYLRDEASGSMKLVTGNPADQMSDLQGQMDRNTALKGGAKSLLAHIGDLEGQIRTMQAEVLKANTDRNSALAAMEADLLRVKGIEDGYKATIASLSAQVDANSQSVAENRKGVDDYKKDVDAQLTNAQSVFASEKKSLLDQTAKLTEDNLALQAQVARLRGLQGKQTMTASGEAGLVDAAIVGVDGSARLAYLNVGADQKAGLGMTFTVYSDAAAIRPDEEGNYPKGKATLEIINVGKNTSTAKITSEVRGNPVVQGEVAANAIYDPNKTYTFVVSGNFDANRDGVATAQERQQIEAQVKTWGGKVTTTMGPEVDFVLMGERPISPAQPPDNAPREVFLEFVRREDEVKAYDNLYQAAQRASIEVLNENRFYTLTGRTPTRAR